MAAKRWLPPETTTTGGVHFSYDFFFAFLFYGKPALRLNAPPLVSCPPVRCTTHAAWAVKSASELSYPTAPRLTQRYRRQSRPSCSCFSLSSPALTRCVSLFVTSQDKDCFTPLHIAAGYLHEKVVEILVKSGANPELQDSTGRSVGFL